MTVSFRGKIEKHLSQALSVKREKLYDIPNMRNVVEHAAQALVAMHTSHVEAVENVLKSAVVMAKAATNVGAALDALITQGTDSKKFEGGVS